MGFGTFVATGNIAAGQVLVVNANGEIRALNNGEQPLPGEVVIELTESIENPNLAELSVEQVTELGENIDLTQDIADIFSAIEQGQDPTQIDDELAPAAGGPAGSSIGLSGTIERDGTETIASTDFVTSATSQLQLSETQSLRLFQQLQTFSTAPVVTDLNVSAGDAVAEDAQSFLSFTVSLGESVVEDVTLDLSLGDASDSATKGADYEDNIYVSDGSGGYRLATAADLIIAAGDSSIEVFVKVIDDSFKEGDETVTLVAETNSDYISNDQASDQGTIQDENQGDTVEVSLTGPDTALEGQDSGEFTITLGEEAPVGAKVLLEYSYSDGNNGDITEVVEAIIGADGKTATFVVPVLEDNTFDPDETFTVKVADVVDPVTGDSVFENLDTSGAEQTVEILDSQITDLSVEAGAAVQEADDAYLSYTVELGKAVGEDVAINLTLGDASDSATKGTDYEDNIYVSDGSGGYRLATAADLIIAAGDSSIEVFVKVLDDSFKEGDETVTLVAETNSDYISNDQASDQGTIQDESQGDTVAVTLVGPSSVREGETTTEFTVSLSEGAPVGSKIVLSYTYSDVNDNDVVETVEAFVGPDGKTATFVVETLADSVYDPNESFTVEVVDVVDPNNDGKIFEDLDTSNANQTVDIIENTPPVATDDPQGFRVIRGDMSDDGKGVHTPWVSDPSNQSETTFEITSSYGDSTSTTVHHTDDDKLGVEGGAPFQGPTDQLQYDRESGQSEQISIKFAKPATSAVFAISNLYADEGEGFNNDEVGTWVAYLNGVAVASGSFVGSEDSHKQKVVIGDLDGDGISDVAFDEVVFSANEYSEGLQKDSELDSSDYYIEGMDVSSDGSYATNQGQELRIPISEILSNDSDIDLDTLTITYVKADGSVGTATIDGTDVVFDPDPNFTGRTELEYQITDGKGGYDEANISVIVNPLPSDAIVADVSIDEWKVHEGETLVYTVDLDKVTLKETVFEFSVTPIGDATLDDVSLADITFTNGVTINADGHLVVPEGVAKFDVQLPTTVDDSGLEIEDKIQLTVGNVGDLANGHSATGTIFDNNAPTVDSEIISYKVSQGDMSLVGGSNSGWNEVELSASYGAQSDQNGDPVRVHIDDNTGLVGVRDGAPKAGPSAQLQFDRDTGVSEKLSVKLETPVTEGSFTIQRLFAKEGDGQNNHETGSWVAYLNGVAVASGAFDGADAGRGSRMVVDIDTDGFAFDEIVFSATEYSEGLEGDLDNDSSDYFVAGFEAEATGNYKIAQSNQLTIPVSVLLANASDIDGDDLHIGNLYVDPTHGKLEIIDDNLVFTPSAGYQGDVTLKFDVIDEHGASDSASIPVTVNPEPSQAVIKSVEADTVAVEEGKDMQFTVTLDKVAMNDTSYSFDINGLTSDAAQQLGADIKFTNGVALDGQGNIIVPAGVGEFEVYVPTLEDGLAEDNQGFVLNIAGEQSIAYLSDELNRVEVGESATDDNDLVVGDDKANILHGGLGNDILIGGLGNDILTGGDDVDIFKWVDLDVDRDDSDRVTDFDLGSDKLDISDLVASELSMDELLTSIEIEKQADSDLVITLSDGASSSVEISLDNHNNQFDTIAVGQVTGDNLKSLVETLFINLPD